MVCGRLYLVYTTYNIGLREYKARGMWSILTGESRIYHYHNTFEIMGNKVTTLSSGTSKIILDSIFSVILRVLIFVAVSIFF